MSRSTLALLPFLFLGCAEPRDGAVIPAARKAAAPKLGPDTRDFDQENLALDLDLDLQNQSLTGTATHTMTALADISQVRMHLADMKVDRVTADGASCTSSQADDVLAIGLDRPRKKGE